MRALKGENPTHFYSLNREGREQKTTIEKSTPPFQRVRSSMRLCANYTTFDLLEFSTGSEAAVEARAGDCGVRFKRDLKGVMVDIKVQQFFTQEE